MWDGHLRLLGTECGGDLDLEGSVVLEELLQNLLSEVVYLGVEPLGEAQGEFPFWETAREVGLVEQGVGP